ncbi:hypothetical protein MFOOBP_25475 [Escherichia coli]|nr:hypothetical protein MFOOBP_25475 [Escherichia coli]
MVDSGKHIADAETLWEYLYNYAKKHAAKGNGFGFGLVNPENKESIARTLSARYHKDGLKFDRPACGLVDMAATGETDFGERRKSGASALQADSASARLYGF